MTSTLFQPAHELARLIRNRALSSTEATKEHFSQIAKHNGSLNAVIQLFEGEAIGRAAEADAALAKGEVWGPLHGVPVTIKEQFWIKNTPSTVNSRMNKDFVATEDSVIVDRIKKAGAVILGKTNVPANLTDYQVQGDIYPEGKNPFDTDRSPGGSTGGGAAALASGMTSLELGGDFGGSIRVPAHFCGLYGLKPTDKTVPRHGMVPLPKGTSRFLVNMAQAGPLARSIDDVELLWTIIRGPHPNDFETPRIDWRPPSGKALGDYKVAWTDGWDESIAGAETREALAGLAEGLKERGATVTKAVPAVHALAREVFAGLFAAMIGQNMPWVVRKLFPILMSRGLLKGRTDFVRMVGEGMRMDTRHYAAILGKRRELVHDLEMFFTGHDVLLCPVSFGPAFRRCKMGTPIDCDGASRPYVDYCWPFVAPFNASGHPALIVPLTQSKGGLPIGVQIVGPYWSEPELLHFARQLGPLTSGFQKPPGY